MSIINLEKTFKNGQLIYCNIDNKIIECICLSELSKCSVKDYNENLGAFYCDKVKVITIYDIHKNIIYEPIQTYLFKKPIKIGGILEGLIGRIFFFKTFIGAFIKNNKLNGIEYYTDYEGFIYKFLYDNISLESFNHTKTFNIYDNERKHIHKIKYDKYFIIYCKNYNDEIKYIVCNDWIKITMEKFPFCQTIYCNRENLKIFQIYKYHENMKEINESRNHNNEITNLIYYDNSGKIKKNFYSNDINPPFSKPLKKNCIELIDYYNKNINNYTELIKSLFKKEKRVRNNLLLNCKLEIINSK